jgi:sulfatase maturation enzyme AslB (radical SAM superfamily)
MTKNIRDEVARIKQSDLTEDEKRTQILTMLNQSSYCVVPWLAASTTTMGKFVTCCVDPRDDHRLRRSDGSEYHILDDDAIESINSQTNIEVRVQMLAGEQPNRCVRCYDIEKCDGGNGATSYRQSMNRQFYDYLEFGETGTLRHIDFRLGNVCNLKCRMCGPKSSSKWFKELKDLNPISNPTPPTTWQDDDRTIEFVSKCASSLVDVRFAGGEPMLSKQHYKIVDYLIETGLSKNIELKYNINGTLMPDDLMSKWSEFKSVHLAISIDGVEV